MSRSKKWWRAGQLLLFATAVAGCAGFWISTSPVRTLFVMMFPAIFLIVGYGAWAVLDINTDASARGGLRVVGLGLAWFWTGVGVIKLVVLSAWTLLGLAVLGGTILAIWGVRARRRSRSLWDVAEVIALSADHPASMVSGSSVEDLCRLWRLTGQEMQESSPPPSKLLWLVDIRQLILDELLDRDPEGMARWLAGRPEKTDPEPYLTRQIG